MEKSNQYNKYMDLSSVGPILLCIICKRPFEDPKRTPCNHIFCRECIITWIRTNTNSCPACRNFVSIENLSQIDNNLCKILDKLEVKCALCGQEDISRENFSDHINNICPNVQVPCSCAHIKCRWTGERRQLQDHLFTCGFHSFQPILEEIVAENRQIREQYQQQLNQTEELRNDIQRQHAEILESISHAEAQIQILTNQVEDLVLQRKYEKEKYLSDDPILTEEEEHYKACKQYYQMTEMPLISVSDEIMKDTNDELMSPILKFAIDKDYNEFNLQAFLNEICDVMNINLKDIDIKKIQKGSVLLEIEIFKNINTKLEKIKIIFKSMTEKIRKKLGKIKVFFMFMGDVKSLKKKLKDRYEIKLHPEWNHTYAIDHTYWIGANNDGIDRGPHPYYCPTGWTRYSLYIIDNFREKFKGWSICYHGTKYEYGLSILLSGLKPARDAVHGAGIYASPSIIYASHPRYAEVKLIESSIENDFFKKGQFIQFVLECRVHSSNIKIGHETLRVANQTTIDANISNNEIEWIIDTKGKDIMNFDDPDSVIFCSGIMVRVTDNHPGLLPESQWWYMSGTEIYLRGAHLGIPYEDLIKRRDRKENCKIIFD